MADHLIGFKEDEKCKRWDETNTHVYFYDEKCNGCKFVYKIGKKMFCGKCEGRVSLHQTIRSQNGCLGCAHYTKKLDSAVCLKCLDDNKHSADFAI